MHWQGSFNKGLVIWMMSTKKIMVKIMVETFLLDILSALLGAAIKLCPRILLWKVTLPILNLFLQMKSAHEQYLGHNLNSAPAKSIVCTKSCTTCSKQGFSASFYRGLFSGDFFCTNVLNMCTITCSGQML